MDTRPLALGVPVSLLGIALLLHAVPDEERHVVVSACGYAAIAISLR